MQFNFLDNYRSDKTTTHILNIYISSFIISLKKLNKYDDKSIYHHLKNVESFDRYLYYCYGNMNIEDIKEVHIESYKLFCYEGLKNNNKTINKKLTSLLYFFDYMTKYKYIYRYNFCLNVPKLRNEEEKKPTIFTMSELKILFDIMRKNIYGQRDICISKLILETGLLTKDIFNIKINDLALSDESNSLTIYTINKTKIYPLSSVLAKEIKEYLLLRSTFNLTTSEYLFISESGNRYPIRSYQLFFKEAITRAEFDLHYTPRHLRSTFLFNMARVINEEKLKELTEQGSIRKYYELNKNPLRNII